MVMTMIVAMVLAIAAASILRWSLTEKRINIRHALRLEARSAAEAAAEYAFAQVRYRMDNQTSFPTTMLDPNGGAPLLAPPAAAFGGTHVKVGSIVVTGGVVRNITNDLEGTHFFVDPADPNNRFDPMKGKRIFRRDVRILAKATVSSPNVDAITAYASETLAMREAPMFAHALFYNMDLEVGAGGDFAIFGPVHTNGDLWVVGQANNGSKTDFRGPVTAAGGIYWGYHTTPIMGNGSMEPVTQEDIRFTDKAGGLINLQSSSGVWRDHKMGSSTESTTTQSAFRSFSSNTFNGYVQTSVHGVENYKPVAFGNYVPDATPNNGVDNSINTGRAMIERPLSSGDAGYNAEVENQKFSRKAGLYIVVNPSSSARTGKKPDGTNVTIPAGQYRAYKRNGTEVILPGSTLTTAGIIHPNLGGRPIIKVKTDAMTDLRRFTNFNYGSNRSYSNRYDPKVIDLVEVDMTALKMAVDWTVNGESVSSIYDYDSSSSDSTYKASSPTNESIGLGNLMVNFGASDWDGTIYIESVDAETRKDSGVRLINGRGRVASTPAHSANEGLTIATNDALYILGDFNADGNIDTNASSLTNSSRYPENANEVPVAVAADAITILSQPTFNYSGKQTGGWNDVLSGHRHTSSNHSSYWATSNPSNSNYREGDNYSVRPGDDPTNNTPSSSLSNESVKFRGSSTEIAAALLTGLVPSNKDGSSQNSGGAHNFPRLLEYWDGVLAIRGSMVALFESRVADEPWSIRYYNAPDRVWGFNSILADGRYPPQTPRVRTYRRVDFSDLTASEYEAALAEMPW